MSSKTEKYENKKNNERGGELRQENLAKIEPNPQWINENSNSIKIEILKNVFNNDQRILGIINKSYTDITNNSDIGVILMLYAIFRQNQNG